MTSTNARLVRLAGGLIAGAVVLTGCSGGSSMDMNDTNAGSSASQSAEFNDADVTFAQGMIVHHEGALEMAQMADGRAQDPRVLDLADRIEAAQDPEIQTMTSWLEDWDQPTSAEESGGMHMGGGMDGGMGMDMSGLEAASGAEFDRMWLEVMTEHHRGAVDMAETEIADGQNADAIALAEQIVESQSAEIEEMEALLTELGG
ncbi:DUF305 domain-containing protein [Blastococcus sp. CT_GayMR19]|uniref:DUF305 domain-containing protein n=1 Tax=Blastococcus sp. CT_GayMR19 TaxID=2559608 RepID=UPI0010741E04|nr:DUF305 domain-containing protein [Blastococcus sp. CT_GayMR19]TFV79381.1 DUF305 domain-containing protein [Blastococcus sp. CT_GayMR19]